MSSGYTFTTERLYSKLEVWSLKEWHLEYRTVQSNIEFLRGKNWIQCPLSFANQTD